MRISYHDAVYKKIIDVAGRNTLDHTIKRKISLIEDIEYRLNMRCYYGAVHPIPDKHFDEVDALTEAEQENRVFMARAVCNGKIRELENELFNLKNIRSQLGEIEAINDN